MKKHKGNVILSEDEFRSFFDLASQSAFFFNYIRQKLTEKELLSTSQVVKKYHTTRFSLYRLIKKHSLQPIFKYRSYYFDKDEVEAYFKSYRAV
jgi:hypothetical protein